MGTILLIVLILLLIGAAPTWPYSRGWGYGPTGGLGTVLLIVLILGTVAVLAAVGLIVRALVRNHRRIDLGGVA